MKTKLIIVLMLVVGQLKAQDSEFELHDNGLIYSENAMGKLKHIVDSLNLKFKVCDINKKYYSSRQALANYISLEGKAAKLAIADIKKNISYAEFLKKYPKTETSEQLVVMSSKYKEYDGTDVIQYYNLELAKGDNFSLYFENQKETEFIHGNWIYQYEKKTSYSDEELTAYYLIKPFESFALPQKYARMIQYSDCLIDTAATVFTTNAKDSGVRYYNSDKSNKASEFNQYVDNVLKRPDYDFEEEDSLETKYEDFYAKLQAFEKKRLTRVDSLKNADRNFMPKLMEAYLETKNGKSSDDEFEEYVGIYISKDAELEMKRNRRVIGGCSMDQSPRIHALNIAILSAETTKWEIFLQSHLNIMNDRFDRVSDGSWSQKGRSTYIREIEDLDINVLDLLFGISFRIENAAENHYYGSIGRLGRALSESKNQTEFENQALTMIEDAELDIHNRLVIYFLFMNYNFHLPNEFHQKRNLEKLKLSVAKLPDYVYSKIDFK